MRPSPEFKKTMPPPLNGAPSDMHGPVDELLNLMAKHGEHVVLAATVICGCMAALAAGRAPTTLLFAWVVAAGLALAWRWWTIADTAVQRARADPLRLNAVAAIGALNGLVHGQVVLFWPYLDPWQRMAQSALILAMCAGTVATSHGQRRVLLSYMVPATLPGVVYWVNSLWRPDNQGLAAAAGLVALGTFVYWSLLLMLARDTFAIFSESFESRQRLRAALDQAEAANRAKTRFLASASHDLRQPIHTLSLFSAALAMRPLDSTTRDISTQMNMALHALSSQLDALLDVSKLDAGIVAVRQQNFLAAPFVHRLREEFAPLAASRGLELDFQVPTEGALYTDPLLLERVLRNLIDNAIKYTQSGRVSVSVFMRDNRFVLCVSDTGPGIPADEQERVFEEFYQLGNAERDRAHGLGLGLSIVRRLAELLQLHLHMNSVVDQGTMFSLSVAAGESTTNNGASPLLPSIRGLKVLVVDDEEPVREGMRALLQSLGCQVQLAGSTDEAERLAEAHPIDIVLADLRLRGQDNGLRTIAQLRRRLPQLAALLISGDTAPARLREAHAAGLRLLHKPTSVAVLTRALREEMDKRQG